MKLNKQMMKLKVTNPTIQADYGEWKLADLIKALANPSSSVDYTTAMAMKYDLAQSELEFEALEVKKSDCLPSVSSMSADQERNLLNDFTPSVYEWLMTVVQDHGKHAVHCVTFQDCRSEYLKQRHEEDYC